MRFRLISLLIIILVNLNLFAQMPNSIHWYEKANHLQYPQKSFPAEKILPLIPRPETTITKIVYGYMPYWASAQYLHFDLLTHIGCFDVTLNPDGSIANYYNFPNAWFWVINKAHQNGVRVEMVATCFGWYNIHQAITAGADNAIANLVNLADSSGVDGINIDFEEILGSDRDTLTRFMQRLSSACRARNLSLTMATMPIDFLNAYNFPTLAETTDGLFIMGYNYHWQGGPEAGPVAPLTGWNFYGNLTTTTNTYLSQIGNGGKLILGLPYYGFEWATSTDTTHSATTGYGSVLYYRDVRTYAQTHGKRWDIESQTPWYAYNTGAWHQGWYDDDTSMLLKYNMVNNQNLIGAGIWALGYDSTRTELWSALRQAFNKPLINFTNGDFETWHYDTAVVPCDTNRRAHAWYAGSKAVMRSAGDYIHSGSFSLKQIPISLGDSLPARSIVFQDVAVLPNCHYELSGWVRKNDGLGNQVKLGVEWYNSNHQIINSLSSPVITTDSTSWRLLTTGNIMTPSNASFARLKMEILGYGGEAYWDDLSFNPVTGQDEFINTLVFSRFVNPTMVKNVIDVLSNEPVVLYNITGRKIADLKPGPNRLDRMNAGVYFIGQTGVNYFQKIIIQK